VQFVHVDDLAAAVVRCVTADLSGTYNVAPDGWIDDAEAAALAGSALPRPALPARLVRPVRAWAWRLGLGTTPPAADAYATYPWVVGSDRLRAAGWVPSYSNEEAVVATTTSSPLATLSPQRRQELVLGATAALGGGVVAALIAVVVRARRRARRP
jgi:nucleoside-diphosphate-sugar epimerase